MSISTGTGLVIGGALGVIGSIFGANAAEDSAAMQAGAANNATELQELEWTQQQKNMQPWLNAGGNALGQLQGQNGIGSFNYNNWQDPGYQFQLQQGQQALARATANSGGPLSGSNLEAQQAYGQQMGNTAYQGAFNRYQANLGNWMSLAGLGQNAGAQLGYQGNMAMSNIGNLMTGGAAAQAAGTVGAANAWMGGLNTIGNNFNQYAMLNYLQNQNPYQNLYNWNTGFGGMGTGSSGPGGGYVPMGGF